jgi:hypothetical protein
MPSLYRLVHSSLVRKGAQKISRKYKEFIISWHDKIHKYKYGDKIMQEFVDEHGEMLKERGVIEIIARSVAVHELDFWTDGQFQGSKASTAL